MPRNLNYLKMDLLSTARAYMAAGSIGEYAIFAGGINGSGNSNVVNAYNSLLVRSSPTVLSSARANLASANVKDYILFGGGTNVVDAYNVSLTHTVPTALSANLSNTGGAKVGNYALFAGGLNGTVGSSVVNAYNNSLTRTIITSLDNEEKYVIGANVYNYAIFASNNFDSTGAVCSYNRSLTKRVISSLSRARIYMASASAKINNSDLAIFAGGALDARGSSVVNNMDVYDYSLTHITTASLRQARYQLAGTSIDNYIVFGGGYNGSSNVTTLDVFSGGLTSSTPNISLSTGRCRLAAATVGDFDIVFAGGYSSSYKDIVDILEDSWKNVKTSKVVYGNQTVIDLTGDTVEANKMLAGYTAHNADGEVIVGTLTSTPAATYTPGTTDQTISSGQILSGEHILKGDANLLAENIKAGVTIFGVTGEY